METKQLKGKIFWIEYTFVKTGEVYIPKEMETSFSSTLISNVLISKEVIKFYTEPIEWDGEELSFIVNLGIMDHSETEYIGDYKLRSDLDNPGKVACELFENRRAYFLKGTWQGDEEVYTWYARIEK